MVSRTSHCKFEYTGIDLADINERCGTHDTAAARRIFPFLHTWLFDAHRSKEIAFKRVMDLVMFHTPVARTSEKSLARRLTRRLLPVVMRRALPRGLRRTPIHFSEHHRAHAAGAWFCSGFDEALCLTADGMGDGLSMTVSRAAIGKPIERLWTAPAGSSFGLFFEVLAQAFGFIPCRDEGKITGLAATGKAENVLEPSPFALVDGVLTYTGPVGHRCRLGSAIILWPDMGGRTYPLGAGTAREIHPGSSPGLAAPYRPAPFGGGGRRVRECQTEPAPS